MSHTAFWPQNVEDKLRSEIQRLKGQADDAYKMKQEQQRLVNNHHTKVVEAMMKEIDTLKNPPKDPKELKKHQRRKQIIEKDKEIEALKTDILGFVAGKKW